MIEFFLPREISAHYPEDQVIESSSYSIEAIPTRASNPIPRDIKFLESDEELTDSDSN